MPVGLRSRVPAKMTSSMREPRSDLADCSPRTQEMASAMFDLPQPLGPMMAATPSPWNFSSVRSQNDLNPRIWSFFSLSNFDSFVLHHANNTRWLNLRSFVRRLGRGVHDRGWRESQRAPLLFGCSPGKPWSNVPSARRGTHEMQ